jgi:hypothetical protein
VYDFAAKGSARRFEFLFCPVDSADAFAIVAAVGVFAVVDYYARVEERAADVPEDVGETTGLEFVLVLEKVGSVVRRGLTGSKS